MVLKKKSTPSQKKKNLLYIKKNLSGAPSPAQALPQTSSRCTRDSCTNSFESREKMAVLVGEMDDLKVGCVVLKNSYSTDLCAYDPVLRGHHLGRSLKNETLMAYSSLCHLC